MEWINHPEGATAMFLGAFQLDGDPQALLSGYERLMETYPPNGLDLHVCVRRDRGITVYDACPTRADFEAFTTSSEFRTALAAAGLPEPRIDGLGEVYLARLRQPVGTR
jgi:hypothetical protein